VEPANPVRLIIFGGLPGVGKTTLARALARQLQATYLRVDSIEQALRDSGRLTGTLADAGYRVAYALALENLRLGLSVVADSVNPIALTRRAFRELAQTAGVPALEVLVVCTDRAEHERRVTSRTTDLPGLCLPSWPDVLAREREFEPWQPDVTIDLAQLGVDQAVTAVIAKAHRSAAP
jgi:predicted kinase